MIFHLKLTNCRGIILIVEQNVKICGLKYYNLLWYFKANVMQKYRSILNMLMEIV